MSGTTWTAAGGNTDWFQAAGFFTHNNWSNGIPTISSTGSQSVVVPGNVTTQPVISTSESGAPGTIKVDQGGFTGSTALTEIQIDGELITLTTGANLTIQGVAVGNFRGTSGDTATGGTISNLAPANSSTASYDTQMLISATGTDKLSFNDISENMGEFSANGTGNTLNVTIFPGGNNQAFHTLINYGLMVGANGGILNIATAATNGTTVSAFANDGWLLALGGTVNSTAFISDDANTPNGAGTPDGYIEIGDSGTAMLLGGAAAKEDVLFLDGTSDKLDLANNNAFLGTISNFSGANTIQLNGATGPATLSYSGTLLTITETGGPTITLNVGPTFGSTQNFSLSTTASGLEITSMACFAAGTRILTPDGDVPVELIKAGSEVLAASSHGDTPRKVIWTGQRTIDISRHSQPEKIAPVRILAGALGNGLPERELVLSPDHCLYLDSHLIEAKTLINGATIIQDLTTRTITYHHIETKRHAIVLAEGVPTETYLESNNRNMFDGGTATTLHPDFKTKSRKNACAPLVISGPVVTAARQKLLSRATTLGFTATDTIDLVLQAGLEKIRPDTASEPQKLLFNLSQPTTNIKLLSSAGTPANHSPNPDDRRRLGAAITGITLIANGGRHEISLTDPNNTGFHPVEAGHRWTNGAAQVKLPEFTGQATLEVRLNGQAPRWASPQQAASAIG